MKSDKQEAGEAANLGSETPHARDVPSQETGEALAEKIIDAIYEKWDIGNYDVMRHSTNRVFTDAPLSEIIAQIAPLTSSPAMESVVAGKNKKPAGWIKTAERPPTAEDADENGDVFARMSSCAVAQSWYGVKTRAIAYPLWMPIPPVPKD